MYEAVQALEGVRQAAKADVRQASDDELLAAATDLELARAVLEAAEGHVFAEMETRDLCDRQLGSNTATWVAHETKGDRVAIRSRVSLANKLRQRFTLVDDALSAGTITVEHARAFCRAGNARVIDQLEADQQVWLARAQDRPFKVWKHELEVWAELVDQDGPFDPDEELARNKLSIRSIGGGGIVIKGELYGELAMGVKERIETRAEQLWERAMADHAHCPDLPILSWATLMARAFEELTREGAGSGESTAAAPVDFTIVLNADEPDTLTDPDGELQIPVAQVEHLWCDAELNWVTTNVLGVLMNLGRTARYANRAQRRALKARDGGCTFPGCDLRASWCDAHHVEHWEHGGDTDICNLALLCRFHHGVTHRKGWSMTATDDQRFQWTTPSGRTLHSQRHRGRPPPGS